jgi:hypothetical protein
MATTQFEATQEVLAAALAALERMHETATQAVVVSGGIIAHVAAGLVPEATQLQSAADSNAETKAYLVKMALAIGRIKGAAADLGVQPAPRED